MHAVKVQHHFTVWSFEILLFPLMVRRVSQHVDLRTSLWLKSSTRLLDASCLKSSGVDSFNLSSVDPVMRFPTEISLIISEVFTFKALCDNLQKTSDLFAELSESFTKWKVPIKTATAVWKCDRSKRLKKEDNDLKHHDDLKITLKKPELRRLKLNDHRENLWRKEGLIILVTNTNQNIFSLFLTS